MTESKRKGKRLIPIPETLLRGLIEVSCMNGKPLNTYVEETLQKAVRVCKIGANLEEMVTYFEILNAQKASGAVFVPLNVFDYLTNEAYEKNQKELFDIWFNSGIWYGKYLTEKFEEPVKALVDLLKAIRWDLNEVQIKKSNKKNKLSCTSTALDVKGTKILETFIKGILKGMGCEIIESEFLKGLIIIDFSCAQIN